MALKDRKKQNAVERPSFRDRKKKSVTPITTEPYVSLPRAPELPLSIVPKKATANRQTALAKFGIAEKEPVKMSIPEVLKMNGFGAFRSDVFDTFTSPRIDRTKEQYTNLANQLYGGKPLFDQFGNVNAELNHLVPKALGGTEDLVNLDFREDKRNFFDRLFRKDVSFTAKQQDGRVLVEQENIRKYKAGEITQGQAISNILAWDAYQAENKKKLSPLAATLASIKGDIGSIKDFFTKANEKVETKPIYFAPYKRDETISEFKGELTPDTRSIHDRLMDVESDLLSYYRQKKRKETFEEEGVTGQQTLPEDYKEPTGFWDTLWEGIKRGTAQLKPVVGAQLEKLGQTIGNPEMVKKGEKLNDKALADVLKRPDLMPAEDIKNIWKQITTLDFDKRYYGQVIGESLPVLTGAIAAGVLTGPAGSLVAIYAPEATSVYNDLIDKGVAPDSANTASNIYGAISAYLENALGVSPAKVAERFTGRIKSKALNGLKDFIVRSVATATQGGMEELSQQFTQNLITKYFKEDQSLTDGLAESFMAGFVGEGIIGTAIESGYSGWDVLKSPNVQQALESQEGFARLPGISREEFQDVKLVEPITYEDAINYTSPRTGMSGEYWYQNFGTSDTADRFIKNVDDLPKQAEKLKAGKNILGTAENDKYRVYISDFKSQMGDPIIFVENKQTGELYSEYNWMQEYESGFGISESKWKGLSINDKAKLEAEYKIKKFYSDDISFNVVKDSYYFDKALSIIRQSEPLFEEARKYKSAEEFIDNIGKDYYIHGSRADFESFNLDKFMTGEGLGGRGVGMSVGDNVNFIHENYATKYGEGKGANLYLVPKKGLNIITPEKANSPEIWSKLADEIKTNPEFNKNKGLVDIANEIKKDIKNKKYKTDEFWNEGYTIDLNWDKFNVYDKLMKRIGVDGIGDLTPEMSKIYQGLDVAQNSGITLFEPDKMKLTKTSKSQLIDIWNRANAKPSYAKKNIQSTLSTKILEKLKGRKTVSKQFILDLTNSGDVTQVERDLIRMILNNYGDTVPVDEFIKAVQDELLPLTVITTNKELSQKETEGTSFNRRELAELSSEGIYPPQYENITLTDDIRGNVANYYEHIYHSPVKTSAGDVHFPYLNINNYFGHTRVEDMAGNKTRRVIEVQSDLYQKDKLDVEIKIHKGMSDENLRIIENGIKKKIPVKETIKNTGLSKIDIEAISRWINSKDSTISAITKLDAKKFRNYLMEIRKNLPAIGSVTPRERLLTQYNNPTAHFRMIREEVRQAAIDGKTKLQFPTGETAMKIEGLGEGRQIWSTVDSWNKYAKSGNENDLIQPKSESLKVGQELVQSSVGQEDFWIVTDVLGDGKFKAVPKRYYDSYEFTDSGKKTTPEMIKKEVSNFIEEFDISGKVDTSNPIYKFYEKEVQRFLRRIKPDMQLITDDKGVTWFSIDITKADAVNPVIAFLKTNAERPEILNQVMVTGQEAIDQAKEIQQRLRLSNVDNELVDTILTNDGGEAFAQALGNTLLFTGEVPQFTGLHETIHIIYENVDNIDLFTKQGISKAGIDAELSRITTDKVQMKEILSENGELLAQYRSKFPPQSLFRKFLNIIRNWFKRVFSRYNGSQVRRFLETVLEGKAKKETIIPATNKRLGLLRKDTEFKGWLDENFEPEQQEALSGQLSDNQQEQIDLWQKEEEARVHKEVAKTFSYPDSEMEAGYQRFKQLASQRGRQWMTDNDIDVEKLRKGLKRNVDPLFFEAAKDISSDDMLEMFVARFKEEKEAMSVKTKADRLSSKFDNVDTLSAENIVRMIPEFRPPRETKSRAFNLEGNKDTTIPLFENLFESWVKSGKDTIIEPYGGAFTLPMHSSGKAFEAGLKNYEVNLFDKEKYLIVSEIKANGLTNINQAIDNALHKINDTVINYAKGSKIVSEFLDDYKKYLESRKEPGASIRTDYIGGDRFFDFARRQKVGPLVTVLENYFEEFAQVFRKVFGDLLAGEVTNLDSAVLKALLQRVGVRGGAQSFIKETTGFRSMDGQIFGARGMLNGLEDINNAFTKAKRLGGDILLSNVDSKEFLKQMYDKYNDPSKVGIYLDPPYFKTSARYEDVVGAEELKRFGNMADWMDIHIPAFVMHQAGASIALTNEIVNEYLDDVFKNIISKENKYYAYREGYTPTSLISDDSSFRTIEQYFTEGIKKVVRGLPWQYLKIQEIAKRNGLSKTTISRARAIAGVKELKNTKEPELNEWLKIIEGLEAGDRILLDRHVQSLRNMGMVPEDLLKVPTEKKISRLVTSEKDISIWMHSMIPSYYGLDNQPIVKAMRNLLAEASINANNKLKQFESLAKDLINKARLSRHRFLPLVPKDTEIISYLEGNNVKLTPEETELAMFMQGFYGSIANKILKKGQIRRNYITHIKRGFLEVWRDEGFFSAIKSLNREIDPKIDGAILENLDYIVANQKFNPYALPRKSGMEYSQDVEKVLMAYAQIYFAKESFDPILPMINVIRRLVNKPNARKWLTNFTRSMLGQRLPLDQWTPVIVKRFINGLIKFTYWKVLALNWRAGLLNTVAGKWESFLEQSLPQLLRGEKRFFSRQGAHILEKYNIISTEHMDVATSMFGTITNKLSRFGFILMTGSKYIPLGETWIQGAFFLGELTSNEYKTGEVSTERQREILDAIGKIQGPYRTEQRPMLSRYNIGRPFSQFKLWMFGKIGARAARIKQAFSPEDLNTLMHKLRPTKAQRALIFDTIALSVLLYLLLDDDDKDENYVKKLLTGLLQDIFSVVDPTSWQFYLKSLTPVSITLGDTLDFLISLTTKPLEKYQSDSVYGNTGDLKLIPKFLKILPLSSPIKQWYRWEVSQGSTSVKAEDEIKRLDSLPPAQAAEEFEKLDPAIQKSITQLKRDQELGITPQDKKLRGMGVVNGERAAAIFELLQDLKTDEEKSALWQELIDKQILTDQVIEQVNQLGS